jgi:hypothetical protein
LTRRRLPRAYLMSLGNPCQAMPDRRRFARARRRSCSSGIGGDRRRSIRCRTCASQASQRPVGAISRPMRHRAGWRARAGRPREGLGTGHGTADTA